MNTETIKRGVSRRNFGRISSLLAAGAAMPFYNEAALAQEAAARVRGARGAMPADAVRISSNENPLGPCKEALEAIYKVAPFGGRYSPNNEQGSLLKIVSEVEQLKPETINVYAGSSDPLHRTVCAFTSSTRSYVMGDPGYEAGARSAEFIGAKVHRVPLRKDFSHDVQAMIKADPNAGVYYICNPNNPTGTLTSRADIEYILANKKPGAILLLDEAYVHFSNASMNQDLVAQGKDVVILRTFSKAFGMAGIRAGLALGKPELLEKIRPYGAGMLPITGLVAATASYQTKGLVAERRKINADIREDTFNFLEQKKYSYVPSVSNKFMLQVNRPGMEIVQALAKEKVFIGRVWPAWPTYVRVSIGTQDEMNKFKVALDKVMA